MTLNKIALLLKGQLTQYGLNPTDWRIENIQGDHLVFSHTQDSGIRLIAQLHQTQIMGLEMAIS